MFPAPLNKIHPPHCGQSDLCRLQIWLWNSCLMFSKNTSWMTEVRTPFLSSKALDGLIPLNVIISHHSSFLITCSNTLRYITSSFSSPRLGLGCSSACLPPFSFLRFFHWWISNNRLRLTSRLTSLWSFSGPCSFTPRWVKNSFLYACNSLYLFYSSSYLFIEQILQWCLLCVRHCSKKFRNTNSLNLQENAEIGIAFLSSLYTWGNSGTERFKNTANKWDIKPAFKFGSKPPKHKH